MKEIKIGDWVLIEIVTIDCKCGGRLSFCENKIDKSASCLHTTPHCNFFERADAFIFVEELKNHAEQYKIFNDYLYSN